MRNGKKCAVAGYPSRPDNACFFRAAYAAEARGVRRQTLTEEERCVLSRVKVMNSDFPPLPRRNRVSGYSANTLKMRQYERCRADARFTHADNARFFCRNRFRTRPLPPSDERLKKGSGFPPQLSETESA